MVLFVASLLFTNPLPLDMPKAEAYLVREKGVYRLEDRFNKFDLWTSRSVDGRWMDDDGRVFVLAHLDVLPPEGDAARSVATRTDYVAGRVTIDRRDLKAVRTAAAALSPIALAEKGTRPRQLPRGYKDVDYWQGTNRTAIVCTYLPEKDKTWRLATWQLVEGDDYDESLKLFEKDLFESTDGNFRRGGLRPPQTEERHSTSGADRARPHVGERDLLRADARHSVAAYDNWHATDAEEFSVLDALPSSRDFIVTLTNDLAVMRRKYAETLPTHVDGSNVLCVARIYANRADYLDALAASGLTNMMWSGAYWCPSRRELVAYSVDAAASPRQSEKQSLLSTIRHEAFHQYLSYATAMIPVSPWLNEGYAEYFETERCDWRKPLGEKPTAEDLERYSAMLPPLLLMDYEEFYSGSDDFRRLKYALSHAVVTFLEEGASKVRFQPFKDVKKDYFAALFETKDMRQATAAAFKDKELLEKFVAEWLKYWKER